MSIKDAECLRFDGRVAVVTGAGRGLGREYALELARRGAKVLVNDLACGADIEPAQQVVEEIRANGGIAEAVLSSIATQKGTQVVVNKAIQLFGRIDIIINNAGRSYGPWEEMIDLNLSSTFWLSEGAWPFMKEQKYGRILTTTSAAGLFGMRPPVNNWDMKFYAYGTSKMGIVGLTRNLAHEGRRINVKVNGVAPVAYTKMSGQADNEDVNKWMEEYFPPRLVTPIAVCLLHETCPVSGEVFSVGGGRVSKVFIGETAGYYDSQLSPEELINNFDAVLDEKGYYAPRSVNKEMVFYTKMMGLKDGPFQERKGNVGK